MQITRYTHSYRLLAFLAVICSIAAVAKVSGDVVLFAISVAGLTAGHLYMWRTRYAVSRLRTSVLSLLLTFLLLSLGRDILFSWTDDPILLARYLVYGQIVTSFDLVGRRNVMGTLVLAGIVFMVLGQMAFDLWYPLLMGIFFLLALAATVAGHVDEETGQAEVVIGETWWATGRTWVGFASALTLLTAAVFLLMPRIGFGPLAQPSWLPSRIDLTRRPPADLPSRPSADVSTGFLVSRRMAGAGSGRYVPLGYTGTAADNPVMHVRSRVVTYWRGATLDRYDGAGWLPSAASQTLLELDPGEYLFPDSDRSPPSRRWYAQTYHLLVDQPNALFTGYSPGRVYLAPSSLVSLDRGTMYRSVSKIPRLSPQRLRRDAVARDDLENLRLPAITDRAAALAESIVEGASTDYDKAARLEEFFLVNYRYDLGVDALTPGQDAVDVFLFKEQAGYCAQFSTAMAVMARHVGLPARVGVGYLPGAFNPMTGAFTVRAGDAHAWVEIHFRRHGWVVFDPTPRPDISLGPGFNPGWVTFGLLDFVGLDLTGPISSLTGGVSLRPLSMPGWTWAGIFGAIVLVGILATWRVVTGRPGPREDADGYTSLEGASRKEVVAIHEKMVAYLVRKGLPARKPAQTPHEYAASVGYRLADGADIIGWLAEATDRAAYDSRPLDPSLATEATSKLAILRRSLTLRTS